MNQKKDFSQFVLMQDGTGTDQTWIVGYAILDGAPREIRIPFPKNSTFGDAALIDAVTSAIASANSASTSAEIATAQASIAALAGAGASAAANMWATISLGIANTADRRYFSTPPIRPGEAAIVWQRVGNGAIEITRIPTAESVTQDFIDITTSIAEIAATVVQMNAST